ncbi:uncharacterized protein LOC121879948 isoform X1 [Homarus americanus]|uniref:Uncharacterized protein n=1 Tax=Homarus americanus TaxID=6706 RepID=A0A8J5MNA8_HOMAM|nr:uncharacterized protein LOC121879948 isoform X1 [Homarus americanus]KAG7157550.1 hypothetical protein Hamer_G019184 [Homarus americanus]
MPPFKTIGSLTEICTERVWRWLYHCLNYQATPRDRMRQRAYILATLNSNIRQQLLNCILRIHTQEVMLSSKCMLLELLGDRSTQWVDVSRSGYSYVDEVFHFYRTLTLSLLINLTRLGVICNVKSKIDSKYLLEINSTFYRVLNQMRHLQWVTLGGVADQTILATLGANCHQLEHLNVCGSIRVNDQALAALLLKDPLAVEGRSMKQVIDKNIATNPCCATLTFVCVSETEVTLIGAVLLLRCVPNLTSLGGAVEDGSLSSVIHMLQPEEGVASYKLNHLWDDRISPDQASLLNVACPELTSVTTTVYSLPSLHLLYPITSLTVDLYFRGGSTSIYNYLQLRGANLKELVLSNNISCPLDLGWLMELTPNLERVESSLYLEEGYEILGWKNVQVASVRVNSSKTLIALLSHIPRVKDLSIIFEPEPYTETYECINDDLVINACISGGLTHLETLSIAECAVSLQGLNCLLLHCPELSYVAPLLFWTNITQDDIRHLQSQAAHSNWRLKLVLREHSSGNITCSMLI